MLFFQVPFSACVHHLSLVEFDLRFVVKHGLCVLAEDGCTTTFGGVFCPCLALCLRFLLLTLLCCSLGVLVGTLSTFFFWDATARCRDERRGASIYTDWPLPTRGKEKK